MADLWPWLAIAGVGALHGLSPTNGWMLAAACGVHARDEAHARRALGPIAVGQVASMTVLACAFAQGLAVDRALMREAACALLVGAALCLGLRSARLPMPVTTPARQAGIALWSFLLASAQGAGLMLVPALVPLCAGRGPAGALTVPGASPLTVAVGALAVHTAAMLFVTGLLATGVCRGFTFIVARCRARSSAGSAPLRWRSRAQGS
jgi:hypothetical protein